MIEMLKNDLLSGKTSCFDSETWMSDSPLVSYG